MKMPMICAVIVTVLGMPATAETQYDRKLEKAVMEIVAAKMGRLRGGFGYDAKLAFMFVHEAAEPDPVVTGSIVTQSPSTGSPAWDNGLALAVERKVSRVISF